MMHWIEELEEHTHHLLIKPGGNQTKKLAMSSNEGRSIRESRGQIFELSRYFHKVNSDGVSAHGSQDLQNKTKMNPLGLLNG